MHYFLPLLPSVVLTVAALLLAIFPAWVSNLDARSAWLRWAIAMVLIVFAVVSAAISAAQTHAQDIAFQNLMNSQAAGFQGLKQDLDVLGSRTPRIPRLSIHNSSQLFWLPEAAGGTNLALNLTLVNDGDDATYNYHYAVEVGQTSTDLGRRFSFMKMRNDLKKIEGRGSWSVLLHGDSHTITALLTGPVNRPINNVTANALSVGKDTAYFSFILDVKTVTKLRKTLFFCGFYQGRLLVLCPYDTL